MAGLERHFAGPMPHHSIGATANRSVGYTTPARDFRSRSFPSPAVSSQHLVEVHRNIAPHGCSRSTQGRASFRVAPASGKQWGITPRARGSQKFSGSTRGRVQSDLALLVPKPVHSLRSRLSISAVFIEVPDDKSSNMKTVDSIQKKFTLRFSGLASEDWVDHVNELELQCARKHCWSARQFFYVLRSTRRN